MVDVPYFTPFKKEHVAILKAQAAQIGEHAFALACGLDHMPEHTPSETAWSQGRVLAVSGLLTLWPGRQHAWAILSGDVGSYMTAIVRRMRRVLDSDLAHRRVEMTTTKGFQEAERLAELLGFTREGPFREFYSPDGGAVQGWVRIRP